MVRRFVPLTVVTVALGTTVTAPATAASTVTYRGKTSQQRTVTVKVRGTTVRNFSAGINMMCVQAGLEFNAVIPPKALKIKRGTFSYRGRDATDGTNIQIRGTVSGKTIKGTIKMSDSRYNAADSSFDSCVGSATFTAKRR